MENSSSSIYGIKLQQKSAKEIKTYLINVTINSNHIGFGRQMLFENE
jgi:hypothetical protein